MTTPAEMEDNIASLFDDDTLREIQRELAETTSGLYASLPLNRDVWKTILSHCSCVAHYRLRLTCKAFDFELTELMHHYRNVLATLKTLGTTFEVRFSFPDTRTPVFCETPVIHWVNMSMDDWKSKTLTATIRPLTRHVVGTNHRDIFEYRKPKQTIVYLSPLMAHRFYGRQQPVLDVWKITRIEYPEESHRFLHWYFEGAPSTMLIPFDFRPEELATLNVPIVDILEYPTSWYSGRGTKSARFSFW